MDNEERAAWKHKIDNLRGDYAQRDTYMLRLLREAHDAATAEHPAMDVVIERISILIERIDQ